MWAKSDEETARHPKSCVFVFAMREEKKFIQGIVNFNVYDIQTHTHTQI